MADMRDAIAKFLGWATAVVQNEVVHSMISLSVLSETVSKQAGTNH